MEIRKNLIYISYFFEPDLGAGAFRNSALAKELASQLSDSPYDVHVFTTTPNRYSHLSLSAIEEETIGNLIIHRINVHKQRFGIYQDIKGFYAFYKEVLKRTKLMQVSFVFASSSKLMSAYLASQIAKKNKVKYYLDIRDLFVENIKEYISFPIFGFCLSNFLRYAFELPSYKGACHINLNSAGFAEGFPTYEQQGRSYYPNGIDDVFLNVKQEESIVNAPKQIVYAGNIGTGQGLEHIIPLLAKSLGKNFYIKIIGSGNSETKLIEEVKKLNLDNVEILKPIPRKDLLEHYKKAHYLFLHLNSFHSFKKVLPSKLFEYAASNIPILAGVEGYAETFLKDEVKINIFTFKPKDYKALVEYLENHNYTLSERTDFCNTYNRNEITKNLAKSIKSYLNL